MSELANACINPDRSLMHCCSICVKGKGWLPASFVTGRRLYTGQFAIFTCQMCC